MGPVRQKPIQRTVSLFIWVCIALCTIVAHNIAQNRPDSFPPYPPDNHHISDDVHLREGGNWVMREMKCWRCILLQHCLAVCETWSLSSSDKCKLNIVWNNWFRRIFTARRSYASAVLGVVIPSVCPSVTHVLCDKSKESTGDIFTPHERAILLVFCHSTVVGERRPLPPKIGDQSDIPPWKITHVDRFPPVMLNSKS